VCRYCRIPRLQFCCDILYCAGHCCLTLREGQALFCLGLSSFFLLGNSSGRPIAARGNCCGIWGEPSKNPVYRILQTVISGCLDISVHTARQTSHACQVYRTYATQRDSSYAIIWTQVTTISEVGFHDTNKHLQFI